MLSSWYSIALFLANSSWVLNPTLRRHWLHDMLEYHAVLLESLSRGCASFMISLYVCSSRTRMWNFRTIVAIKASSSASMIHRGVSGTSIGLSPSEEDQTISFVSKSTSLSGGSKSLMCSAGRISCQLIGILDPQCEPRTSIAMNVKRGPRVIQHGYSWISQAALPFGGI